MEAAEKSSWNLANTGNNIFGLENRRKSSHLLAISYLHKPLSTRNLYQVMETSTNSFEAILIGWQTV
jgi:hypothetical protein